MFFNELLSYSARLFAYYANSSGFRKSSCKTFYLLLAKFYCSAGKGIERAVAAHTNVGSGSKLAAVLPDDDIAGLYDLAAEYLYAKAFRYAIAA